MGLLFSKIWKLFWTKEEVKLVVAGLDGAGKSTITYRLTLNSVVMTAPTIGSNVEELTYKNIHMVIMDLGGQESLRRIWSTYYSNTKAVIFVIDSTDRDRIHIAKTELQTMLQHELLENACVLVFANKQDVKGAMTASEISQKLDLVSIREHQWQIQPCCALSAEGLHQGLDWIVSHLTAQQQPQQQPHQAR